MTHKVDTAFDRTFSEPPNVVVSAERTHCEACKEPLAPDVVHKCHGNKHYEPRVFSSTEITELCPACMGEGILVERDTFQAKTFVVVCKTCRTYTWPEVISQSDAIHCWNAAPRNGSLEGWPKWLADMPGDNAPHFQMFTNGKSHGGYTKISFQPHPDLSNYKGVCPACSGTKGTLKDAETGVIEPCATCDGKGVIG